jgi:hypothetical protein
LFSIQLFLFLFPDKNQSVNVASKLKLLNINAAAQLTVAGYEGELQGSYLSCVSTEFGLACIGRSVSFAQLLHYWSVT